MYCIDFSNPCKQAAQLSHKMFKKKKQQNKTTEQKQNQKQNTVITLLKS